MRGRAPFAPDRRGWDCPAAPAGEEREVPKGVGGSVGGECRGAWSLGAVPSWGASMSGFHAADSICKNWIRVHIHHCGRNESKHALIMP